LVGNSWTRNGDTPAFADATVQVGSFGTSESAIFWVIMLAEAFAFAKMQTVPAGILPKISRSISHE
jgi:hypothetical protein